MSKTIQKKFNSLCVKHSDNVTITKNCLATLEEISNALDHENYDSHDYRRAINSNHSVQNSLLPLLKNCKDDNKEESKIIDIIVKIMVDITTPLDYLFINEMQNPLLVQDIETLIEETKASFADDRVVKALVDHLNFVNQQQDDNDAVADCLMLIRNLLHVSHGDRYSVKNQIIWNLFVQSIDKVIIGLLVTPGKESLSAYVVQVIAVLYKKQQISTLQKLLNTWLEQTLSESSEEDDESNTSLQEAGDLSPAIVSSDPMSDSSDNGNAGNFQTPDQKNENGGCATDASTGGVSVEQDGQQQQKQQQHHTGGEKRKYSSSQSDETSDCGYATQIEGQTSEGAQPKTSVYVNTSTYISNDVRKKKLVKRSGNHLIKIKGLTQHQPSDDDITHIIKEFTVDFLLKGYGNLIENLYKQSVDLPFHCDNSHLFWLLSYFPRFAVQLELDLEHYTKILKPEIFSYLLFQSVWILDQLEIDRKMIELDIKPHLRQLHLIVSSLKEFLHILQSFDENNHNQQDKKMIDNFERQIAGIEILPKIFLLLLNFYDPEIYSKAYLEELITTNDQYLVFLEKKGISFDITTHLKQFANTEMMSKYAMLLEDYKENGEAVNDCIFTMMHHVGGDLNCIHALFQPSIIKTFTKIWETDYEISNIWTDLVVYVIHKYKKDGKVKNINHVDSDVSFTFYLQDILVKICNIKYDLDMSKAFKEPILYHYLNLKLPVPLVPWSVEQYHYLREHSCVEMLDKYGFLLPEQTGGAFYAVPNYWNIWQIYSIACELGPIDSKRFVFDVTTLEKNQNENLLSITGYYPPFTNNISILHSEISPFCCNSNYNSEENSDTMDGSSISSDLVRMFISEDEK